MTARRHDSRGHGLWTGRRRALTLALCMALAACENVKPSVQDWFPSSSVDEDLPWGEIANRNLNNVKWAGRRFEGQTFENLSFVGADLTGVNFNGTVIRNVDFSLTTLNRASFRGAELRNVTFYASALRGVDFTEADLQTVILDATDLRGSCFEKAELWEVPFEGAVLSGGHYPEQHPPNISPRSFYALVEQLPCPGGGDAAAALYGQYQPPVEVQPIDGPMYKRRSIRLSPGDEARATPSSR
ncbi:pentapeptide repeat-containing protein [Pseudovibrio sp. SPO723]|uniref:pentapeptide repeat-containing protein n=1 Tax=Nesiotobacter zosterae TaxID=392721 RepID=UPI0029C1A7FB|nr:pentapeptide repeat-containing protein [Pseudovibrio sp. SPO723]MDX5594186.1 pentapeptide repeat-containing protein [Pseudovibrio sp. SPO723]